MYASSFGVHAILFSSLDDQFVAGRQHALTLTAFRLVVCIVCSSSFYILEAAARTWSPARSHQMEVHGIVLT
jgi:hypothetical protein